ncbi:hypothetical protein F5Y16DRAFT_15698 [Xylariaceae sp. FL0255]|nr:hypothetical protein F5Y16DRAFT_15698 [Xylariaceae sp. FL0255]
MMQQDLLYKTSSMAHDPWNPPRSFACNDGLMSSGTNYAGYQQISTSRYPSGTMPMYVPTSTVGASGSSLRLDTSSYSSSPSYVSISRAGSLYGASSSYESYPATSMPQNWPVQDRYSPTDSADDGTNLSDHAPDSLNDVSAPSGHSRGHGKGRSQRRSSNRDEFDGPHQFLSRPPADYVAQQERELPHLPTNLLVQEQDSVLAAVNDRLSQCAFDFVAKYQFPIPLTQEYAPERIYLFTFRDQSLIGFCLHSMRPVERPQDREWTEWVYLLKRLATKRRIPARVLYNGQIKQFVTILENSLEMRHAAKHQSRPLKDDRNILQLISAGIQVARIVKDASAMDYLDRLYVSTEQQIHDRTAASSARFR